MHSRYTIKNHKVNTIYLVFAILPVAFFVSYYLLVYYVNGDQVQYHEYYSALKGVDFSEILRVAKKYVSSNEPLSGLVLWAGSNLDIKKSVYISILNVFLVLGVFLLSRKYSVKTFMIALLLTNFYIVVLMTSAERLKIAYIFLVFSAVFAGKTRWVLAALSPFAHLQSLLFLPSIILASFENDLKRLFLYFKLRKRALFYVVLLIGVAIGIFSVLGKGVLRKGAVYAAREHSPAELVNLFVLTAIALFVSVNRFRMSLVLLPMYPAIVMLGGHRVNMIAVTLVIYYLMIERRLHHPLLYFLMIYFSVKSLPFVKNIIVHGNGFA